MCKVICDTVYTKCLISLTSHTPHQKGKRGDHVYSELFQRNNLVRDQSDSPFSVLGIMS